MARFTVPATTMASPTSQRVAASSSVRRGPASVKSREVVYDVVV
ncbi:hypothetical protein [Rhodococcus sp. (in: high G+C Gram-positive bacteria)]|nr:hypothetical protein [Rhodococcus sp. (in: high G+C Gram-positive bacteria)]